MANFERYQKIIENPHPEKKVKKIDFAISMENMTGTMNVTDIQVQDGAMLTGWGHKNNELLKPWDSAPKRYYNAIVRGEKALMVPNEGDTMGFVNWTITADTNMNIPNSVENEYAGRYALEFGMMYRTRNIRIYTPIKAGDEFKFWADPMTTTKNGVYYNQYAGFFLGAPAGDMYYLVSIPGEQAAIDSYTSERIIYDGENYPGLKPQTDKRARVFLEVTPRWLAEGGKHL